MARAHAQGGIGRAARGRLTRRAPRNGADGRGANGAQVAVKILEKEKILKQNMAEQVKKEIAVMKRVEHRQVVRLLDVLVSRNRLCAPSAVHAVAAAHTRPERASFTADASP